MNFASYADFREKTRSLIEGDEIGETFSTTTLDTIIGIAENRVYRELRTETMFTSATLTTVASNALALPTDIAALDRVIIGGDQVEVTDLWRLEALNASAASATDTVYCARKGSNLIFFPEVADSTSITLYYYARPTAMADEATWANQTTLARYPEVFIYAACAEASPFLGEDNRALMWEQKYANAMRDAKSDDRWRVYSGSPLRVRTR